MDCEYPHDAFHAPFRVSQTLSNDRCQNILYKAVIEHFIEIRDIAALLLTSKSFQNSSFGANFLINFNINEATIVLFNALLAPSSCLSLQFVPSLSIDTSQDFGNIELAASKLFAELANTKYLPLQLRSIAFLQVPARVVQLFFSKAVLWPRLTHVNLRASTVGDSAIALIAQSARNITSLDLTCAVDVTRTGLQPIATLTGITELNLTWSNSVAGSGLEFITPLVHMTSLDLSNCDVGDDGLQYLASLDSISELILTACDKITDAGVERISHHLSNIATLILVGCASIGDEGLAHLAKLEQITTLVLSGCVKITDVGLGHISKLTNITCINLAGCHEITAVGIEFVCQIGGILSLNLSDCGYVTDFSLQHLIKSPNMTFLDISSCPNVSDVGLQYVSALSKLSCLYFVGCKRIDDVGLEHISKLSNLTTVMVYATNISIEAQEKFAIVHPNCQINF